MAEGSLKVVLAALGGNAAIAVAKFVAFALSGSSAMLTEAIHSLVDTGDQILLLVGQKRAGRRRNASHPLGYGMEMYFWSFIVALMVFLVGGAVSVWEGVRHIIHPEDLGSPWISFGVLAVSAVFEGSSFGVGFREYRHVVRHKKVRIWDFIRLSKDPNLFAVLLEDSAALIGIGIAALGVVGSSLLHIRWADGAASILIGLLLMAVAFVLANETRSLIAGEAVAPPVLEEMKKVLDGDARIDSVDEVATLHLGPQAILVALTLSFKRGLTTEKLRDAVNDLTRAMHKADGRVAYVYVRPAEAGRKAKR